MPMPIIQTRRRFINSVALASAAGFLHAPRVADAEEPPETTSVRLPKLLGVCVSPTYIAEDLLRTEGFTDIRYEEMESAGIVGAVGRGKVDFGLVYSPQVIPAIDAGEAVTLLGGIHVGCFELFVKEEGVRNVADLKGKSVGVQNWGSTTHVLVALMAAHVGLDPATDIHWVAGPSVKPIEQFVEGKIDAVLAFPPQPQD